MSLLSLFKNTNDNNPHTLIWGQDQFLNDYLAQSYISDKKFKDFEQVTVDCESDGLNEAIADLTESSLFAQQKIVLLKNPFFLTAKVAKKYNRQLKQLEKIMAHVDELDDIIVMVATYANLDRRKKITKTVLRNFNVVQPQVRPYEVEAIVKALIKAEGYSISRAALQMLVQRSDQVMDTVLSNFNKLKMIARDQQISEQDVSQNIDLSLAQNVFSVLTAALARNYREAIERLDDQLRQGSNPIQILAVFENQIELILVSKILAARGRSQPQIVKELGVHPYRIKLALRNKIAIDRLAGMLKKAIELDYHYKNGTLNADNFLQMYILSI